MENITINIVVRNKLAECTTRLGVVRGNSNYLIRFELDEEWDGYEYKTAVFTYRREGEDYVQRIPFTGNICPLPTMYWDTSMFYVGLTAGNVITSTPARIYCEDSITDMYPVTDEPPTDVYNMIMEHIKDGKLQGLSAYEVAVGEGFSGTEAEWLESLRAEGDNIVYTDGQPIPDYVLSEADRVADIVRQYQTPNTMTIMAVSDPHQCAEGESGWFTNIDAGNRHCGMAMELIKKQLHVDLTVMLGDYVLGGIFTTTEQGLESYRRVLSHFGRAFSSGEFMTTAGNHDHLSYGRVVNGSYLSDAQLYPYIGIFNRGMEADETNRLSGCCFRDFDEYKLRVIMLNLNDLTDGYDPGENGLNVEHISEAQREWLCNALMSVNDKKDADSWGIILCSHEPADCGYFYEAVGSILIAYSEKSAVTVNSVGFDFSSVQAKFLFQLHGHTHNYKVDKIRKITDGAAAPSALTRIAVPNSCFYRSNEYGENDGAEYLDIEYGEDTTYNKTAGTAEDTAFCIFVVDKANETVRAIHYGAGYDRVIDLSEQEAAVYTVTQHLTGCTSSFTGTSIAAGETFSAAYTALEGYSGLCIEVTMGGESVPLTSITGGNVLITNVTGDIVITAAASVPKQSYTNLVPTSTDSSGSVYNGTGYKDGYRLNSSAEEVSTDGLGYSCTVTGFIPFTQGRTIRIGGSGILWNNYGAEIAAYDSSYAKLSNGVIAYQHAGNENLGTWVTDEANSVVCFTPCVDYSSASYIRVSAIGSGEDLIVTIDEEIT